MEGNCSLGDVAPKGSLQGSERGIGSAQIRGC